VLFFFNCYFFDLSVLNTITIFDFVVIQHVFSEMQSIFINNLKYLLKIVRQSIKKEFLCIFICLLSDSHKKGSQQSAFLISYLWLWQLIYTEGKIATFSPLIFCLLCEVYAFAPAVSHSVAVVAVLAMSVLTLLVV
jgi:hypothetical protein